MVFGLAVFWRLLSDGITVWDGSAQEHWPWSKTFELGAGLLGAGTLVLWIARRWWTRAH